MLTKIIGFFNGRLKDEAIETLDDKTKELKESNEEGLAFLVTVKGESLALFRRALSDSGNANVEMFLRRAIYVYSELLKIDNNQIEVKLSNGETKEIKL